MLDFAEHTIYSRTGYGSVLDDGSREDLLDRWKGLKEAYVEAPQMIRLSKLAGAHVDSSFTDQRCFS